MIATGRYGQLSKESVGVNFYYTSSLSLNKTILVVRNSDFVCQETKRGGM